MFTDFKVDHDTVINDLLKAPICCHAHRINHAWKEAENWFGNRVTIKIQILCGFIEIELITMKI